jgi:hypothetical protein
MNIDSMLRFYFLKYDLKLTDTALRAFTLAGVAIEYPRERKYLEEESSKAEKWMRINHKTSEYGNQLRIQCAEQEVIKLTAKLERAKARLDKLRGV